jgi:topoisomerase IA-like protein
VTDSPSMTRTEALLATIVIQNMGTASQAEKCVALNRIGLNNSDIADILGTTTAVVSQSLYTARKSKGSSKSTVKKAVAKKGAAKKTAAKKTTAAKRPGPAKRSSPPAAGSVLRGVRRG